MPNLLFATGQVPTLEETGLNYGSKKPLKLGAKVVDMVKKYIFAVRSGGFPVNKAVVAGVVHAMSCIEHRNCAKIDNDVVL